MAHVILKGYNELDSEGEENSPFSIVTPTPVAYSSTKIKRWWRKSYKTVTYEGCALIEFRNHYIVVSCLNDVELKITSNIDVEHPELQFKVGFNKLGDGNVRRILVVQKTELYNPINYEDYYFDYNTKSFIKNVFGNGSGVDIYSIDNTQRYPEVEGSTCFNLETFPLDLGPLVTTTPTGVIDLRRTDCGAPATTDLNPLN